MDERIERQELYCHNCDKYVQFPIDLSMDGNYVLNCPNCNHEHCRTVRNGIITESRWAQRNGLQTFQISASVINFTSTSASTTGTSVDIIFGSSWGTTTGNTTNGYTWAGS